MRARYPGTCKECSVTILPNEPIKRDTISGRMRHVDCKAGRMKQLQTQVDERKETELFGFEYG
jgi:hypothetical protein